MVFLSFIPGGQHAMIFFSDGLVQLWDICHPTAKQPDWSSKKRCNSVFTDPEYRLKSVGKLIGMISLSEAPDEFDFQTGEGDRLEIIVSTFSHIEYVYG